MESKPRITRFFFVAVAAVAVTCLTTIGFFWIRGDITQYREESRVVAENLLAFNKQVLADQVDSVVEYIEYQRSRTEIRLKTDIRERVDSAHAVAMNIYRKNKGRFDDALIQNMIIDALRPIRFNGGRGYYFITAFDGVEMLFADHPELEGKNLLAMQDTQGRFVIRDMIKIARQKTAGFYHYTWTKPGSEAHDNPKIAYVKHFKPYDWFIGTGAYTADVDQEIRREVLARIEKIRFSKEGYVFAGTLEGISLSGPARGKNMIDVKDVNGVKIVRELISAANAGGGFVQYVLPAFKGYRTHRKLSFAKEIKNWHWYVGAGVDITDIERAIAAKRVMLEKDIKGRIIIIMGLVVGLLCVMFVVARYLSLKISRDYGVFYTFLKEAASKRQKIDLSKTHFDEFRQLAKAANEMIRDLQKAEQKVLKSEENLRTTLDSIGDAVIATDTDGNVVRMNPVAEKLTGWTLAEALDRPLAETFNIVDARTKTPAVDPVERVLASGKIVGLANHTMLISKDGIEYQIADSGAPIRDSDGGITGVVLVFRDVTEEYALQEKIAASEEKFRGLVESSSDWIWEVNAEGVYIYASPQVERMLGYKPEEIVGKVPFDLMPPDGAAKIAGVFKSLIRAGKPIVAVENINLHRDGHRVILETSGVPVINEAGKVAGYRGVDRDITERKRAAEALSKSEIRYRTLFESAGDAIFMVRDNRFINCNQKTLEMFGCELDEIVDHSPADFSPAVQPDGKNSADAAIEKISAAMEGSPQRFEWRHKKLDGSLFDAEVSLNMVEFSSEKYLQAVVRDITERKKAEKELYRLRNYLANILDSMPSVLVGVDVKGRVTQWNKKAEQTTGIAASTAKGKSLSTVFPQMVSEMEKISESIRTRETKQEQKRPRLSESGACYEDVTVYPLTANGVEGAVIRIDDVTERVRLEEMMVQSEKMLSIGGLAAGMAHEINNPLAGMMQTAEVMGDRLTNIGMPVNRRTAEEVGINLEGIRAFMEKRGILRMIAAINESGRRVAAIVDNMLNFARRSEAQSSPHDMADLLDRALELAVTDYDLKKHYDFKLIEIIKEYADKVPPVPCEEAKIQQVLLNILRNGAQAMQAAETKNPRFIIRTRFDKEREMVCLGIEDNGPGMDEATRKRVFEPFFTTKPQGVGTGLGLSVSYFIVTENHGGTMAVESMPGKGAKFIVRLPVARGG